MQPNLSFDQAPPLSVPFRFFLAAPVFGILAGLLMALRAPEVLASRWSMEALAVTHLLTAGFMLQAMTGAMLQFIPVATGGNVWRPGLVAGMVQPLILVGALLLCGGFLWAEPSWFMAAAILLSGGVGILATVLLIALWRSPGIGANLSALRVAVSGLVITVILGATLATGLSRGFALPYAALTNLHMGWGLGVWALVLLAGVSYYVVPMFQLTPAYPPWLTRILAPALIVLALLWLGVTLLSDASATPLQLGMLLVATAFAVATLTIQYRRRRRVPDVTLTLFRFAMSAMIAAAMVGSVSLLGSQEITNAAATPLFGVLCFTGVFVSAINGMLYKIVPFANWLHLQRIATPRLKLPNMNQMIAPRAMAGQSRLHMASVMLMIIGVSFPDLARVAGVLFAVSCAWLGWNLISALRTYTDFRDQIRASEACREP